MNRAQRRMFAHTIRGYRLVAGRLEKCAPGQETPMRIEVRTATAKP